MTNILTNKVKSAVGVVKNFFKSEDVDRTLLSPVKENLKHLRLGMFWYDDNLISEKFIAFRRLRAIVLGSARSSFVGFFPSTEVVFHEEATYETGFGLENTPNYGCVMKRPKLSELKKMHDNLEVLNKALRDCGWPELAGEYWVWNWRRKKPVAVFDMKTGKTRKKAEGMSAEGIYIVKFSFKLIG